MATEVFRTNVRQEGSNSGMITKTIRSNKEQILNTGVESKYLTAGQIASVRFRNLAEFNNLRSLKTFDEHKGSVSTEVPIVPITPPPVVSKTVAPPAIEIGQEPKPVVNESAPQEDQFCSKCSTKMILASDTNSSGAVRQLFLCPKCSNEVEVGAMPSQQTKKEESIPRRVRRRIFAKAEGNKV